MFYKDPFEVYRVRALDAMEWLVHGFETRFSGDAARSGLLATLRQVHSNHTVIAAGRSGCLGEGDALIENAPGRLIGVKTADCLPVLLVDERRRAVAAVHAGWRGTAQQIVRAAAEGMARAFETQPEDLHAAIGPGIGPCCYEVGPEVAARFAMEAAGTVKLNLVAENRRQLLECGVPADHIYAADLCTQCRPEEFHSFRRDKEQAGRMYSFIGLR